MPYITVLSQFRRVSRTTAAIATLTWIAVIRLGIAVVLMHLLIGPTFSPRLGLELLRFGLISTFSGLVALDLVLVELLREPDTISVKALQGSACSTWPDSSSTGWLPRSFDRRIVLVETGIRLRGAAHANPGWPRPWR